MQYEKTSPTSQAAPEKPGMGLSANTYSQAWNLLCGDNSRTSVIVSDQS